LCAALLAVAGTAMAITADPSGNTAPAPTIQSDKADYSSGELVTLTGSNWQPGESVNIVVNDDAGQTWNRNVNVTADQSGNISDSFNLPDWFVATYSVKATGASGAIATTSFTDGQVKVETVGTGGASAPISWVRYSNTTCTPGTNDANVIDSGSFNAVTTGNGTTIQDASGNMNLTSSQSLKLTAGSVSGFAFSSWSPSADFTTGSFTSTSNPGCLKGNNGALNTDVNYAVNQAPVLSAIGNKSVDKGQQLSFTASATDPDGDTVSYSLVAGTGCATGETCSVPSGASIGSSSGAFSWTPDFTQAGTYKLKVVASDGSLSDDEQITITVNNVNRAPVATGDTYSVNEDATLTANGTGTNPAGVLSNDSDPDGDTLSATLVSNTSNGTLTLNANGSFSYTPTANYNGPDSFTYKASDGQLNSNIVTVSITVNAVDDVPSFQLKANPDETVFKDSGPQSVAGQVSTYSPGPTNESSQVVDFLVSNDNTNLFSVQPAISANGTLTYTPAPGAIGTATVTVKAHDNGTTANGGVDTSAEQTFKINVTCNWTGFFQPIDNNHDQIGDLTKATVWNSAKAGQAIPIKFSLSGDQGLSILATKNDAGVATTYPRSVAVKCPGATYPVDAIETYSSSTAAGLHYDPIANQYVYNWKTATSLANSCQMLDLKLADGTHHYAFFKFTK
jgi:VCBS repeat-containing protein